MLSLEWVAERKLDLMKLLDYCTQLIVEKSELENEVLLLREYKTRAKRAEAEVNVLMARLNSESSSHSTVVVPSSSTSVRQLTHRRKSTRDSVSLSWSSLHSSPVSVKVENQEFFPSEMHNASNEHEQPSFLLHCNNRQQQDGSDSRSDDAVDVNNVEPMTSPSAFLMEFQGVFSEDPDPTFSTVNLGRRFSNSHMTSAVAATGSNETKFSGIPVTGCSYNMNSRLVPSTRPTSSYTASVLHNTVARSSVTFGSVRCKLCRKVLANKTCLQIHMRVHSGLRPYSCPFCDVSFSQRCNLNRHVSRIHHKEKPYQCDLCFHSFTSTQSMNYHKARYHVATTPGVGENRTISEASSSA